jgi:hypothetical protein
MKFEGGRMKCERERGLGISNFTLLTSPFFRECGFSNSTLHPSNFLTAIKRNFEELGV